VTPDSFPRDPVGYARQILGIKTIWDKQAEIARALLEPPHRVLVRAGHNVGKSFLAAWITNWFFDNHNPGIAITTAPDQSSVETILWSEIRAWRQRAGLGGLLPKSAKMETGPEHWAIGKTSATGEGFQGRHKGSMLFVFDEAVGVDAVFWETTSTMFSAEEGHYWLAICNPTDTTSQFWQEEMSTDRLGNPRWRSFALDARDHPNIHAQLRGEKAPIPGAVTLAQLDDWVESWCEKIEAEDATATDFEWRPGSGRWYRPGPIFESRVMGVWPSFGAYSLWNSALFAACCDRGADLVGALGQIAQDVDVLPQIGCDVARFGDDYTALHSRWGHVSLYHEDWNGLSVPQIAEKTRREVARLVDLANRLRKRGMDPLGKERIAIKIDDDGVGGGLVDVLSSEGYWVIPINAGSKPASLRYPNKRSELWFTVRERATMGLLSFGALSKEVRHRLKTQLCAIEWAQDAAGRRVIEPKDRTKDKLGRSPDDGDALNLAYYETNLDVPVVLETARQAWDEREDGDRPRRKLFG